jgi:hypothetical protein
MAKKAKYTLKRTFGKKKNAGKVIDRPQGGGSKVRVRKAAYTFEPAYKKKSSWNGPKRNITDKAVAEKLVVVEEKPVEPVKKPVETKSKKPDYDSMSYRELQAEAKKNGLKSVGVKKVDLLKQLKKL